MKYLFIGLMLVFLISYVKQAENAGYRIEQLRNNDGSYFLKILDKNNSEIVTFHFNNDGSMGKIIMEGNDNNFRLLVNFVEDNIASYLISDGIYSNTTNVFNSLNGRDAGLILNRSEQINENIAFGKEIDINGLYILYRFYSFGTGISGKLGPIR